MLWIGIDAATEKTGVVAVNDSGQIAFNELIVVSAKKMKDPLERSTIISERFANIIANMGILNEAIIAIGIEEPIYVQNPGTTIKLSILWGMLYETAKRATPHVYKIPITDGKYALTESRKATKRQMIKAVQLQFGYLTNEHCADATGIALATRVMYLEELWKQAG